MIYYYFKSIMVPKDYIPFASYFPPILLSTSFISFALNLLHGSYFFFPSIQDRQLSPIYLPSISTSPSAMYYLFITNQECIPLYSNKNVGFWILILKHSKNDFFFSVITIVVGIWRYLEIQFREQPVEEWQRSIKK